ncbi:MAG: SDR family NAD(P)-dependent oxidoreductase, partial [Clostridia bacterium]|nr:SDR family NAD(P)-dependent oxidoreductase [Clostridia bacterium]
MRNKLQGKVAVITGASRGIGLAVARNLYEKGVVVYDISRHFQANP